MHKTALSTAHKSLLAFLSLGLCALLFLPGLHGPFVFDDITNITSNSYLKIKSLDWSVLLQAARSGNAGPLGRPVAMLSFALDYYVAGSFDNTFPFKLSSLLVHLANGCLVFILLQLVNTIGIKGNQGADGVDVSAKWVVGLALGIIWVIHPIQINAVHYVVQRMTSLSAFFVLLTIIFYLYGRLLLEIGRQHYFIFLLILAPLSLLLGLFSKENAVLAIPLIGLLEYFFFRDSPVWKRFKLIDRRFIVSGLALAIVAVFTSLTLYALPGYSGRDFTISERLLTETRVIAYYLYLIIYPAIYNFGLFHDDIQVSTSLLDPVSTLTSGILLLFLIGIAIYSHRRSQYLSFGILWFLVAHSLESTVIPLELIHEHRNYLALLGPLFVLKPLLERLYSNKGKLVGSVTVLTVIITISFPSYLRSEDWKSQESLIVAESSYHPKSARAHGALGSMLTSKGDFRNGLAEMTAAHALLPKEGGYLMNRILIKSMMREPIPGDWEKHLYSIIGNYRISPLTMAVLESATICVMSRCSSAQPVVERALTLCAARTDIGAQRRAPCYYYLGSILSRQKRYEEAAVAMTRSHNLDKHYLHPLFGSALISLRMKDYVHARSVIEDLIKENRIARYQRTDELSHLISTYNREAEKQSLPGGKIDISL